MPDNETATEARERNRHFYDGLWSSARLIPPDRFNTWPHFARFNKPDVARLELGPGLRPRLPIGNTDFVDLSEPALAALTAADGRARLASVEKLPFADNRFDVVVALDVIEHTADATVTLAEIARVARPGSELWLSVPLHPGQWQAFDDIVGHCRRFDIGELQALLAHCGLEIEASAAYGMKPGASRLVDWGMRQLAQRPKQAMWLYNRVFMPIGLRRQKPIELQYGLIDTHEVSEILLRCRRIEASPATATDSEIH